MADNSSVGNAAPPIQAPRSREDASRRQKGKIACKFFGTKSGCRAGQSCPFLHADDRTRDENDTERAPGRGANRRGGGSGGGGSRPQAAAPPASHQRGPTPVPRGVVPRPTPAAQVADPRAFQIAQVVRRFGAKQEEVEDEAGGGRTRLTFRMAPTDPDFPFDVAALDLELIVPRSFPESSADSTSAATLRVRNADMPRGFQINVERGWDTIVGGEKGITLLRALARLDRDLEVLLTAPRAETLKIVAHQRPAPTTADPSTVEGPSGAEGVKPAVSGPAYSPAELDAAAKTREAHVRQLRARLGRAPGFEASRDGRSFGVPVDVPRRAELPPELRGVTTVKVIVPALYDLEPCALEIPGGGEAARRVERRFARMMVGEAAGGLVAAVNRLVQQMHLLARPELDEDEKVPETTAETREGEKSEGGKTDEAEVVGSGKSRLIVIPRPPEWTSGASDGEHSSEEDSLDSDEGEEGASDEDGPSAPAAASAGPERGILMSLPALELHGIELLELTMLSLTVRCGRCRNQADVSALRDCTEESKNVKTVACKKCSNQMSIGYRMDMMHANCVRAGYLDLDGCVVVDMLPSYFAPTCTDCSTPHPAPGVVSVRGESTMAICRECHKRMSFRIPEVKFLQVSTAAVRATQAGPRKKKEQLGIKVGEQLPNRGRCAHYSKSYRWFRFSCCSKVFPCDKCHDAVSDHPNENANRMICGYCSREQNFRPEDCGACHASLVARRGTGFWEGGKGTRDKVRMSRKDPRKYKRTPGTAAKP